MSAGAAVAIWLASLIAIAGAAATRTGARLALVLALAVSPLAFFVDAGPIARFLLAFALIVTGMRAFDFTFGRGPKGFLPRVVYMLTTFVFVDSTLASRRPPALDLRSAANVALAVGCVVLALLLWSSATGLPALPRYALRLACAAVLCLAAVEIINSAVLLITAALGVGVPAPFVQPFLSRSVAEFWNRRWNVLMSEWLRRHCFVPLSSRGAALALIATFALSGLLHAYLIAPVGAQAAASWAAFFCVQPALIFAERRLRVRRWPPAAAHAWTVGALLLVLPLFVVPVLPVIDLAF